jgi:hypothetical protein
MCWSRCTCWAHRCCFAAFTGVLLFASSIIAGWTENWFVLHRLDSAMRYNPRITRLLGTARAALGALLRENISGFAANISLGFMLGLVPAFAGFFGLGLDVRHVTFDLIARYFTRPVRRAAWAWATTARCWRPRRHAAGRLQRHAGGRPPLLCRRGPRAPGPQGAGRQPVGPGGLRRAARWPSRWRWRCPGWMKPGWLAFRAGCWRLADAHGCELVGGDTTQGPLNICITVFGEVPAGQALLRSGARPGDDIYVSGTLGDARLALELPAACGLWTPQGSRSTGALLHSITSPAESFTPL